MKDAFSKEGLDIDQVDKSHYAKQFEGNKEGYECKVDQERKKKLNLNMRKVTRSINLIERQNRTFLRQISNCRRVR